MSAVLTIPTLYLLYSTSQFISHGEEVTGTIISVSSSSSENGTTYLPTIAYTYNEQGLEVKSNAGSGNRDKYKRGAEIGLLVDTRDPQNAEINATWELWASSIVVGGMTALCWLAYLTIIHSIWSKKRFMKMMRETGTLVKATVDRIEQDLIKASNSGVTVRKKVYRVYAKGLYEGSEREFKSDMLRANPEPYGVKAGSEIPVYVNPKKPKQTFMDFSGVPGNEDLY